MKKNNLRAYAMLLAALLIFGTIGVFRRFIPLSSGMLAFARGVLGSSFLLLVVLLRGGARERPGRRDLLLLAVSGAAIGFNWILLFEAYNHTTVATATMCYYMQPTLVILFSPLVLRERLTAKKLLCAAAAVCGMVLISGVLTGEAAGVRPAAGVLCGLGAAAFYAAVVMLNKKVRMADAYLKTLIQLLSASVVLVPYLLLTEDFSAVRLSGTAVWMVLIVGVVHTGFAYALYFGSIRTLPVQSVAVLSYLDPVFALFLSAAVLHEKLTPAGAAGAVLILGSALCSELSFRRRAREEKSAE